MGNTTQASARERIEAILDDNSFVEIGAGVKAEQQILTCRKKTLRQTVLLPDTE